MGELFSSSINNKKSLLQKKDYPISLLSNNYFTFYAPYNKDYLGKPNYCTSKIQGDPPLRKRRNEALTRISSNSFSHKFQSTFTLMWNQLELDGSHMKTQTSDLKNTSWNIKLAMHIP